MKYYWRLMKKNDLSVACELRKNIPELKNVYLDKIQEYLNDINIEFYVSEKIIVPVWIRLTLPLAFIVMLLLIVGMPVNYIICGRWGYNIVWIRNWFNYLGF